MTIRELIKHLKDIAVESEEPNISDKLNGLVELLWEEGLHIDGRGW